MKTRDKYSLPVDARTLSRAQFRRSPLAYLREWVADFLPYLGLTIALILFGAGIAVFFLAPSG